MSQAAASARAALLAQGHGRAPVAVDPAQAAKDTPECDVPAVGGPEGLVGPLRVGHLPRHQRIERPHEQKGRSVGNERLKGDALPVRRNRGVPHPNGFRRHVDEQADRLRPRRLRGPPKRERRSCDDDEQHGGRGGGPHPAAGASRRQGLGLKRPAERVLQLPDRLPPVRRVLRETRLDHPRQSRRRLGPKLGDRSRVLGQDRRHHRRRALPLERALARQQLVQHQPEREDVRPLGPPASRRSAPEPCSAASPRARPPRSAFARSRRVDALGTRCASPKSSTFTPAFVTRMFEGLRSRCTIPFWCACSSASAICPARRTASAAGSGPARGLPSTYSITR